MLNYIWLGLMVIALIVAAINGTAPEVTKAAFDSAKTAVELSIGLVGVMALWLGVMKIAEAAGLITFLSRAISPVMRWIFPDVPREHPAMGAMVMNIAATMLGLNNAATPLGLKAMEELQTLNGEPEVASNAMVMFMAINTSGIQLIPATVIALLAAAGSRQPTAIIGSSLIATTIGTMAAITATKLLERFYPAPPSAEAVTTVTLAEVESTP